MKSRPARRGKRERLPYGEVEAHALPLGLTGGLDRHSIRAGVRLWLPLLSR